MKAMMISLVACSFLSTTVVGYPSESDSSLSAISLCQIVSNETEFVGKEVTLAGFALAGSHAFEISVGDDRCPDKFVVLAIPKRFATDADVQALIMQLYPGYPDDEAYTEKRVQIRVGGKFVLRENRGLQSRVLEVENIHILKVG